MVAIMKWQRLLDELLYLRCRFESQTALNATLGGAYALLGHVSLVLVYADAHTQMLSPLLSFPKVDCLLSKRIVGRRGAEATWMFGPWPVGGCLHSSLFGISLDAYMCSLQD